MSVRGGRSDLGSRPGRWWAVVAAALLLAACDRLPDARSGPHLFGPWQRIPPADLGLRFTGPAEPEIIAARRRASDGGLRIYEGTLANATTDHGENLVVVVVRERRDGRPIPEGVGLATVELIPQTVQRNFQTVLKGAVPTSDPAAVRRNRYGRYHYLSALYPSSSQCIYAWQHVDGDTTPLGGGGVADASVQLRYCDPHQSPAELIVMFDSFDLTL